MKKTLLRYLSLCLLLVLCLSSLTGCADEIEDFHKDPSADQSGKPAFAFSKKITPDMFSFEYYFDREDIKIRGQNELYEGVPCEGLFYVKTTLIAKMELDGKVYEQIVDLSRRVLMSVSVEATPAIVGENMTYEVPASELLTLSRFLQDFSDGKVVEENEPSEETFRPQNNLFYFSDAIELLIARVYPYTISNYPDFVAECKKAVPDEAVRIMLDDLEIRYSESVVLGTDLLPYVKAPAQ